MHGPAQRAVDELAPADVHRWIQARQSGAGLHRLRDRHVVPALPAEAHRFAVVEVDRDHVQRAVELAEIVAAPTPGEDFAQEQLDPRVVEQAGGHQAAEAVQQVRPARVARAPQQSAPPLEGEPRQACGAPRVFEQRRAQEGFRAEAHVVAVAGDEDPAHLARAHAVGEARREERTAADADVAIHAGQVEALDRILERAQRAQLVHPADRAAAGNGEADAWPVGGVLRGAGFALGFAGAWRGVE